MPEPCLNCHHATAHDADNGDGGEHCGFLLKTHERPCRAHKHYREDCAREGESKGPRYPGDYCWSYLDLCPCTPDQRRIAELEHEVFLLVEERAALRAKNGALHRRAQKAESALAKALKEATPVDTWASPERQREAAERDRMMDAVGKVGRSNV